MVPASTRIRLDGCNQLLTRICGKPMRFGAWLAGLGFDPTQRGCIRHDHLPSLLESFNEILQELTTGWNDPRVVLILQRHLGLDGLRPETLPQLGEQMGVSRERIRQLEAKPIRRLSSRKLQRLLEDRVRTTVIELVGPPSSSLPPNTLVNARSDRHAAQPK
ncbi:MAG: sigma factor-like helix-turn-helix DNA-binding protein [Dehalococcoidia bacterium]